MLMLIINEFMIEEIMFWNGFQYSRCNSTFHIISEPECGNVSIHKNFDFVVEDIKAF